MRLYPPHLAEVVDVVHEGLAANADLWPEDDLRPHAVERNVVDQDDGSLFASLFEISLEPGKLVVSDPAHTIVCVLIEADGDEYD